jgi:hypothetical protein
MKILSGNAIKEAIKKCAPTHIAVAYVGSDWECFINPSSLKEIIVSPTIGSNPDAIRDLANKIGWNKIFFLDELHAKIFLGKERSIIGSANLTSNGLSGVKLEEICIEINNSSVQDKLLTEFNRLKEKSDKDEKSKQQKLAILEEKWRRAISSSSIPNDSRKKDFMEYDFDYSDKFYVCCHYGLNVEYNDNSMAIKNSIKDYTEIRNKDKIDEGKFVLLWRITQDNKPDNRQKLSWLYVHMHIKNGTKSKNYPQLILQRNDMTSPDEPFELTNKVQNAFKKAIVEDKIAKYLIQEGKEIFNSNYAVKGVPNLIKRMKEILLEDKT